jgi:hypothetical protein
VAIYIVGAGVALTVHQVRRSESTPALRGEATARIGQVPGWDGPTVVTYALNEAEAQERILDGKPQRLNDVDLNAGRKPHLPMPGYPPAERRSG